MTGHRYRRCDTARRVAKKNRNCVAASLPATTGPECYRRADGGCPGDVRQPAAVRAVFFQHMENDTSRRYIDIVKGLAGLPEPAMRLHGFIRKTERLEPETVAELLYAIVEGAAQGSVDSRVVLACIDIPAMAETLGNYYMSRMYEYAQNKGLDDVVGLLSRPAPRREYAPAENGTDEVPPGVRVALSKTRDRSRLSRLLLDSNPRVIRTVLKNPALTETDVLKICTRRPVAADILREVYKNTKWTARYAVKKALILNPYTPTEIGLKLVHFMMQRDLQEIAATTTIHAAIREIALSKTA